MSSHHVHSHAKTRHPVGVCQRQAGVDRSVAPPLGLTLSTCAMRVCARCVVWSLHHPHAAWSRYPTRHVFPRAARYTCPVHKCPIAGARACVRIRRRGSGAESPGDIERCSACGGHGHRVFRQQVATQPSDLPAGTGLTPGVNARHICTGTGLTPAISAPGLGSPPPHLHRDWAHPRHICTGTGLLHPLRPVNGPDGAGRTGAEGTCCEHTHRALDAPAQHCAALAALRQSPSRTQTHRWVSVQLVLRVV